MKNKTVAIISILLSSFLFASLAFAGGPHGSVKLKTPREYVKLPKSVMAKGHAKAVVDARIKDNVRYIVNTYKLKVTSGRETGHLTHGDGTGVDFTGKTRSLRKAQAALERASAIVYVLGPSSDIPGFKDHIHVSWNSNCHGCGGGKLVDPRKWVAVFRG